MLKCEVVFNNEKIIRENIYTPEKIQKATDEIFSDFGLVKGKNGFYLEAGNERDFMNFSNVLDFLETQQWFIRYIKSMRMYENMEEEDTGEFEISKIV